MRNESFRLAANPDERSSVNRLTNHPDAFYQLRVGNYRVLFDRHDDVRAVAVIGAGHRKTIYL